MKFREAERRIGGSVAARRRPIITIMVNYKNVVIPRKLHSQINRAARGERSAARVAAAARWNRDSTRKKVVRAHAIEERRNGTERSGKRGRLNEASLLPLPLSLGPPRGRKIIVNLGGATPFTGPSSSPPRSRLLGFESSSRFGLTVSRVSLASCTGAGRSSGVELGGACEPQNSRRLTSRLSGYY